MQLSKDEFAILSDLLDQGLDLPASARGAWLKGLPESFPGSNLLLTSLFAADANEAAHAFLDTLPKIAAHADGDNAQGSGLQTGSRIGVYVLIREIGHGGMATVWLARRTDELTERPVALKLPHLHLQSTRFAERYARERDILASLTHPNIARLYDAGISPEGQPFLAMEFVAGEPLTQYCAKRHLGVVERLQLFLRVLAAVDYAHSERVIHRDLKPSNILLRDGGQIALLDFGIAKMIVEGHANETELTLHGGAALTPHYASPEQIRGGALTPATDIYSLGVLLYELLSGQRPYELTGSTRRALEDAILTTDPRPPSELVTVQRDHNQITRTSRGVAGVLQRDLDLIVLKALKKRPEERYLTATEFADDLRRHLKGEAISARSASLGYRVSKWLLRHRPALRGGAIMLIAIAATVFGAGALWQRSNGSTASIATSVTTRSAVPTAPSQRSVAVLPFVDLSEKKDQEYFSDGLSEELIERLAQTPDLRVIARTSSFQFKGKDEDMRSIGVKLGVANLLRGSVRLSGNTLRVTAQLFKAADGSRLWSGSYDREMGDIFKVQDSIAASVITALQATMAKIASSTPFQSANMEAYNAFLRGAYLGNRGAKDDLQRALTAFEEAIRLDPGYTRAWIGIANVYNQQGLAGSMQPLKAYDEGHRAIDRALMIQPNSAAAYVTLSDLEWNYRFDFEKSREDLRRAHDLDPASTADNDYEAYEAQFAGDFDKSIELFRQMTQRDPLNVFRWYQFAVTLWSAGRLTEAEHVMQRVLELNPGYAYAYCTLGELLLEEHKPDAALTVMRQETDQDSRWCTTEALWALGHRQEADALLAQATATYAKSQAYEFAGSYALRGDKDAAFLWLTRAYDNREPALTLMSVDPVMRNLRGDPRFTTFLRKLKLPE